MSLRRLIAFGLLLSSPAFAAPFGPAETRARAVLAAQPCVRVGVTSAPGMGHQAAAATIVRRLRELGYRNQIEAVYDEHARDMMSKLATLFPGFRADGPAEQDVPTAGLRFVTQSSVRLSVGKFPLVELALMGGDDRRQKPAAYRARHLLTLQPANWGRSPEAQVQERTVMRSVLFKHLRAVPYAAPEPPAFGSVSTLRPVSIATDSRYELLDLVTRVPARFDLAAYYGHGLIRDVDQLILYVKAIARAQSEAPTLFAKPVVVPVLITGHAEEIWTLRRRLPHHADLVGRVKIFDPADDPSTVLRDLAGDHVLIVPTAHVPPALFEFLFSRSSVAPVTGGRNSIDLMAQSGRPYLASNLKDPDHFGSVLSAADTEAYATFAAARRLMHEATPEREADVDRVAKYLVAAKSGASDVTALFTRHRIAIDAGQDRVVRVLDAWLDWRAQESAAKIECEVELATSAVN